jgi:nucleoid DNA-binding protein
MEGKVLLQDLAQSLAAKNGIQRKDAETFVRAFFETISEGILQDKIVKIKGFGTFKMIDVQDRESVNVNTGERIIIPGHSKISFTPDSELKDQVNRPFALFQTVVINEGTSLDDMERVDIPETVDSAVELEEPVTTEEPDTLEISETPERLDTPDIPEEPETLAEPETPEEPEIPETHETPKSPEKPVTPVTSQLSAAKKQSWWHISSAMTALLFALLWIVFLAGYFIGSNNWMNVGNVFNKPTQTPLVQIDTVYVVKMVEPDSVHVKAMEDSLRKVIKEESTIKKELPKPQATQIAQAAPKPAVADKKTPVVFEIVGHKGVRTIQWGDYLLKIVRQEYGTDDALRYVISYNKFTDPNNLPVGTEVKLPKLRVK